jgi:hypothetical protein
MTIPRFALFVSAFLLPLLPCSGQIESLRTLFEALAQPGASKIPDPVALGDTLTGQMPKVTVAELQTIVPAVLRCLESRNQAVRADASTFLYVLAGRLDSAQALEPYDSYLISVLDGKETGNRLAAIGLLGGSFPRPSPRALAALAAHLNDEKNTGEEFKEIAAFLLVAFPADPAIIHAVLASTRARPPKDYAAENAIKSIGLARITNDEALEFVRAGFHDLSSRFSAVQAVSHMPKDVRDRFASELQAVAEDPDERPDVRSTAQHVLLQ